MGNCEWNVTVFRQYIFLVADIAMYIPYIYLFGSYSDKNKLFHLLISITTKKAYKSLPSLPDKNDSFELPKAHRTYNLNYSN